MTFRKIKIFNKTCRNFIEICKIERDPVFILYHIKLVIIKMMAFVMIFLHCCPSRSGKNISNLLLQKKSELFSNVVWNNNK